jgi:hypothetical protein
MDLTAASLNVQGTGRSRGFYYYEDGERAHQLPSEFYFDAWAHETALGVEWFVSALGRKEMGKAASTAEALAMIIGEVCNISREVEVRVERDLKCVAFVGSPLLVEA